ncbi:MAG TPA: isocitrate/isopropylmalate dehydrogenase family protein [Stellaceae bacterium]|nr:isocitrate/isopropylmalate dehydrogenase family protein [Stellaceae bacterium]
MNPRIVVLEGDGIGPEIIAGTVRVMEAALRQSNAAVDLVPKPIGLAALERHGHTVPAETRQAIDQADGILLGPVTSHVYDIFKPENANPSAYLRKTYDLYANVRPARSRPGIKSMSDKVDLVVMRENTEGFYADRNLMDGNGELRPDADTVLSVRLVTRKASMRIARAGFELARARGGKKRVSLVHKANVLRRGDGLFLECCRQVAKDYPEIAVDDFHIDAAAMHLILRPEHFDVIITTNMYGDILSDEAAGLVGGLGLAPGLNAGDRIAMAQAVHGSAPDIAGKGIANPSAEMLSAAMLLEWLGHRRKDAALRRAGELISAAVDKTIAGGKTLTPDLGGKASTDSFAAAVASAIG